MKLYLAGPMTGIPEHNFPAFNEAAEELRQAGYDVVNPAEQGSNEASWAEYMKRDIPLLLQCEAVATLPNWDASRGARLEVHIANALGMEVGSQYRWLEKGERQCR